MSLSSCREGVSVAWLSTDSVVSGKDGVVLAGVKGVDVVVVKLTCEVVFSKLELNRALVAIRTSAKAVLPHGNSSGNVRKGGVALN